MRAAKMSERRRSAVALSSRAHAFSVEALIGSNKKRKLRDWEEKGLDLSMEALSPAGPLGDTDDPATHGLEPHPGECVGSDNGRRVENEPNGNPACGGRPCPMTPGLAPTLRRGFLFLGINALSLPKFAGTNLGGWPEPCILIANFKQAYLRSSPSLVAESKQQFEAPTLKGCGSLGLEEPSQRHWRKSPGDLRLAYESSRALAGEAYSAVTEMPRFSHLVFLQPSFRWWNITFFLPRWRHIGHCILRLQSLYSAYISVFGWVDVSINLSWVYPHYTCVICT